MQCVLDTSDYPTSIRYTDIAARPLHRHDFHPEWDYTLHAPDTPSPHLHCFVASH